MFNLNSLSGSSEKRGTVRKIFVCLLVLCMSMTSFAGFSGPVSAETDSSFIGTMTELNNSGSDAVSGTSYSIGNDAEFGYFVDYVNSNKNTRGVNFTVTTTNETYSVTSVIAPCVIASDRNTSSPYVNSGNGFAGTFNGGGNTFHIAITSSVSGTGMFGYIAPTGTVENLTSYGTVTVSGECDAVGGIAGYNSGIIDNVTSSVTVNAASSYNVGGIAGFNDNYYMTGAVGTIRNSENVYKTVSGTTYGGVTGFSKAGGIAGENSGIISSCYNETAVTATCSSKNGAGGITGRNGNNNTAAEIGVIRNCYNHGVISASNGRWAGGIAGFQNRISSITNCYNTGSLTAYSNKGQISGKNEGNVTNCYGLQGITTDSSDGVTLRTDAQMKSSVASELGSAFEQPENQYPTLKQTSDDVADPVETGHGSTAPVETTGVILGGTTGCTTLSSAIAAAASASDPTIYVAGPVTLTAADSITAANQVVVKRSASYTGPMFILNGETVTLDYITFDGNNVTGSNVIRANAGTLALGSNITFQNINSNAAGGAVHVQGAAVNSSAAYTNCSARNGGAVSVSGGSFTMNGGSISGCSAAYNGGAIYITEGTLNLNGGTITGNSAAYGNGIYVADGTFNLDPTSATTISDTVYLYNGKEIYCGDSLSLLADNVTVKVSDESGNRVIAEFVNSQSDADKFTYADETCTLAYDTSEDTVYISSVSGTGSALQLMDTRISTLDEHDWSTDSTITGDITVPSGTVIGGVQTVEGGTEEEPVTITIDGSVAVNGPTVEAFIVKSGYVVFAGVNDATMQCNSTIQYMILLESSTVEIKDITFDAATYISKTPIFAKDGSTCHLTVENSRIENCTGNKTGSSGGILIRAGELVINGVEMSNVTCRNYVSTNYCECIRGIGTTMVIKEAKLKGNEDTLWDVCDVTTGCSAAISPTGNVSIGKMTNNGDITLIPQSGSTLTSYKLVNTDGTEVTTIPTAETSLGTTFTSLDIEVGSAPAEPTFAASIENVSKDLAAAGETFTADVVLKSDTVPAAAQLDLNVNSDVAKVVAVTPAEGIGTADSSFTDGTAKVSFYGNTASAAEGLKVATVTFEAVADGTASITLANDSVAGITGDPDAEYTITVPETAAEVTIKSPTIETAAFGGNYQLVRYTPNAAVAEGKTVKYGDQEMYLADDDSWYCVIAKDVTPSLDSVTIAEGTQTGYTAVDKGDVNENGKINIIDAQIAYDIGNSVYTGFEKLTVTGVMKADANNNMAVDALDARAIQVYVHTGAFN